MDTKINIKSTHWENSWKKEKKMLFETLLLKTLLINNQ